MLETFTEVMRQRLSRPLQYFMDICIRCGLCADACHFYADSRDLAHIPAYRALLVKKLLQSKGNPLLDWYRENHRPDERTVEELRKALWDCTGCRRCTLICPFHLDTGLLVSTARYALLQEGLGMNMVAEIGNAEVSKGEIIDALKEFYVDQIRELEGRIREEWGVPDLRIPVDEPARVLYVPVVGEHAIIPLAKIFHAAKESWTLSIFTATNHSFFVGDTEKAKQAAHWIVQEARRLGAQVIAYAECGHATRTLLNFWDHWFGDEIAGIQRVSVVQLVASYLQEGRIRVREGAFDVPMTYHDPCNLGRNAGIFEEPRMLIRAVATDFRELTPNRELNWCCGGGGGLIAEPEMFEVRMKAGRPKVEQIQRTGAKWVVTACENCKTQLGDLNERYGLGVEIKGVVDLIADALVV
jgi:Fe-S oxidoreductase